jgi:hypothetical protein
MAGYHNTDVHNGTPFASFGQGFPVPGARIGKAMANLSKATLSPLAAEPVSRSLRRGAARD